MASGYLGFTSFTAVYEETQNSLNRLQGASSSQATPSESADDWSQQDTTAAAAVAPDQFTLGPRTRDACLFVLQNVPEPARGKVCLRGSPCEAWYYHFLDQALVAFYETFGNYFGPRRSDKALGELAMVLSRNTALPFSDEEDVLPAQWIAQFSGPSTRWETLGLLFAFWDFGNMDCFTPKRHLIQDEDGRPSQVAKRCVDLCLDLCHEFSPANSMLLFLSHKRLVLETVLHGDMS